MWPSTVVRFAPIVTTLYAAAEHRRLCEGRDLYARRPDIDAIDGRAIDLCRRVQTLGGGTDELEIPRSFQWHALPG